MKARVCVQCFGRVVGRKAWETYWKDALCSDACLWSWIGPNFTEDQKKAMRSKGYKIQPKGLTRNLKDNWEELRKCQYCQKNIPYKYNYSIKQYDRIDHFFSGTCCDATYTILKEVVDYLAKGGEVSSKVPQELKYEFLSLDEYVDPETNTVKKTNDIAELEIERDQGPVAQRIEQRFPKPKVVGSTPTRPTNRKDPTYGY
jgi:hypothetical protein